jgi:glutamate--cysteine ligase
MQTICGVHYNFSLTDAFWDVLYAKFGGKTKQTRQDFVNEINMNLVRNFIRWRWLFVFLFGASPYKDESYKCRLMAKDRDNTISLRSSRCGYSNPAKLPITYNSFRRHLQDLQFSVDNVHSPYTDLGVEDHGVPVQLNDHILQIGNEYYFSIRLKPPKPYDDMVESLAKDGVRYVEVRIFDVNPFEYTGVSVRQMYFAQMFLLMCLLTPGEAVDDHVLEVSTSNQQDVALFGRNPSLYLHRDGPDGKSVLMRDWAKELLNLTVPFAAAMDKTLSKPKYLPVLEYFMKEADDPKDLPAFRIVREMERGHQNFIEYGLMLARKYSKHNL